MFRRVVGLLVVLPFLGFTGCGSNFTLPSSTPVSITISLPSNTSLFPGQSAQFSASVSNASNSAVDWEVNSIVGGNSQVGTVTAAGLYTAPATVPSTTSVTITAAAAANTSATATATVTLLALPVVSISPSGLSLFANATQQFTATVTNSNNTAVTWSVNGVTGGATSTGTISASGLYTAPAIVPNPSSVTIKAVSAANASSAASVIVTILPLAPIVTVSPSNVSVPGNTTQQFAATVTNTTNTAVTWEVNAIPGGNSTVGTITTGGLYTAPPAIPIPATVAVTAVSTANPTSVGSATITVTTPEVVSVSPPTTSVQPYATQPFTAVSSIPNDTITWQVNGVTGGGSTYGTITTGANTTAAVYTAPTTAPSNPLVVIKAISGTNPSIFGSATVSIGTAVPTVSVTPNNPFPSVAINTQQQFSASVSPSNLSQAVVWQVNGTAGGSATWGTISTSGLYTAPSLVPTPATVTITAVSSAAANLFGTSSAIVTLPTTPISVTNVVPTTPSVMVGQSDQFSATVTPNNNPAVTWTVSSTQFGCVASISNACGSISSTGNYTAPTSVPGGGQSAAITVTATSVADPTKFGNGTVTVTPVPTPTVTISTTSTVVCSVHSVAACTATQSPTLTAVPNNFPANAQLQFNWTLSCINGDDGDDDQCGDNDGDPSPTTDGPGMIEASGGGPTGMAVTDSNAILYLAPEVAYSLPVTPTANQCPSPGSNSNSNWAYVAINVSTQYNGNTYSPPQPTCIQVIYQFQ